MYLNPKRGYADVQWNSPDHDLGYDGPNDLKGRKLYRHHQEARPKEYCCSARKLRTDQNRTASGILNRDAEFEFDVSFTNLSEIELGALLWSLQLEPGMHHRIGYAKPLGFGSATCKVLSLTLDDKRQRFKCCSGDSLSTSTPTSFLNVFKSAMSRIHGPAIAGSSDVAFAELPNIRDLASILSVADPDLPIHYPRPDAPPHPDGKSFEWNVGNRKKTNGYRLQQVDRDTGLPLIKKSGHVTDR